MKRLKEVERTLDAKPTLYAAHVITLGPYRLERRGFQWEVTRGGGHLRFYQYLDQAIAFVLELDEDVDFPDQLQKVY